MFDSLIQTLAVWLSRSGQMSLMNEREWSCSCTFEAGVKSSRDRSIISNGLQYVLSTLPLLLHPHFYNQRFVEHAQQVSTDW